MQNVHSDKHHSGRVDNVVSNTQSENRQKGVVSTDSGLENVPPPGSHPLDDSSSGQRELPGDTSLDNRARDQDDDYPNSKEKNTGSGNCSSQRADNRSLPVWSNSRESGLLGTWSGRVQKLGSRHTPGSTSISHSGHGRNSHCDKRRSKSPSFSDSARSRSRERSRKYSGKKKSHRQRSLSGDSYRRRHKKHHSRSCSHGDKRSRSHHHTRGRNRSCDKRRRSSSSPSLQEKRSQISCSSSDKDLVQDVVSGSITDNEFEGESVASPAKKSVPTTHRVKDKTSTHSEEADDKKISYAESIEEVFNLLPASICPRKNESSIPSKPRSGIYLLNPSEDKESSSLPQSQLVKDIHNLVQTYVSDKVKLESGWTALISLEKELGTHMKFNKLHNEQFPAGVPKVDKDALKLDLSSTGSINVTSKFLESMECQARHIISINLYADLFATAAFIVMQSVDMDTNMLRRLVEALVNCLKHSTNLLVLLAVELMLARRELAISGCKILTDASKDSLRSVPFSADSLFGGKISEIQKANSVTHQQKLIADSVSQKPATLQSQSSQFRTPQVPRKKQDSKKVFPRPPRQCQDGRGGSRFSRGEGTSRRDRTVPSHRGASSDRRHRSISSTALSSKGSSSRRTPGPFCKRVGKNNSRQMDPFCRKGRLQGSFCQETDPFLISTVLQKGRKSCFRRRGPEAPPKEGSGEHKPGRSRFFLPNFPSSKKERKVKTYNRSVQTEQVPEYLVIQYGNSKQGQECDLSQRLSDITGSYGRLSSCSNSRDITEIFPILSEGSSVSVQGTSVSGYKSFCLHSIDGCHSNTSQSSSNYSVSIPGRLAGQESVSSPVNQGQGVHSQIDYFTGSNNQSREIGTNSIPKFHIHRDGICNSRQYCQSSLGQSTRYSMLSILVSEAGCCHSKNVSLITGETECVCSICGFRQATSLPSPDGTFHTVETACTCTSTGAQNICHRTDKTSSGMVVGQGQIYTRSCSQTIPSSAHSLHRCEFSGWGAHLEPEGLMCHGVWQQNQSQLHINILEMKAILLALKEFQHILSDSSVMIATDSSSVVAYLQREGGTHCTTLCMEVWETLHWCHENGISLRVRHIPGRTNILADRLS